MANINIIKNWFKAGAIPTQGQFSQTWDSFWHKEEKIPVTDIEGLQEVLDEKANTGTLQQHINDNDAHGLAAKLALKTDVGHTHDINDVQGLASSLTALQIKIDDKLKGNLKFEDYPSSRNDGQLPTNKVLSTDEAGNLKMYTIATSPPPYLSELISGSYLPSNTGNFILRGAFFTPTMTVVIQGQTINYKTFISDNEMLVNVTTGAAEGVFDVILNNGLVGYFPKKLLIFLGTLYQPGTNDWINRVEPVDFNQNEVLAKSYGNMGSGIWKKELDYTKNFRITFKFRKTPLGPVPLSNQGHVPSIELLKVTDNSLAFGMKIIFEGGGYHKFITIDETMFFYYTGNNNQINEFWDNPEMNSFEYRKIGSNIYAYYNGVSQGIIPQTLTQNTRLRVSAKYSDVFDIKYIETA